MRVLAVHRSISRESTDCDGQRIRSSARPRGWSSGGHGSVLPRGCHRAAAGGERADSFCNKNNRLWGVRVKNVAPDRGWMGARAQAPARVRSGDQECASGILRLTSHDFHARCHLSPLNHLHIKEFVPRVAAAIVDTPIGQRIHSAAVFGASGCWNAAIGRAWTRPPVDLVRVGED